MFRVDSSWPFSLDVVPVLARLDVSHVRDECPFNNLSLVSP